MTFATRLRRAIERLMGTGIHSREWGTVNLPVEAPAAEPEPVPTPEPRPRDARGRFCKKEEPGGEEKVLHAR